MENNKALIEQKPLKKLWLYILGGIALTAYVLWTAYMLYAYFDVRAGMGEENAGIGLAIVLALVVVAIGIMVYAADTVVAIIGLIIAIVKRKQGLPLRWVIGFAIMSVLPAITEAFLIIIFKALGNG